jgi:hypothetical protein
LHCALPWRILSRFVMDAEDRARKLCERAVATQDPGELAAILVELRALIREQLGHVEGMIQQRRLRADLEHVLAKSA